MMPQKRDQTSRGRASRREFLKRVGWSSAALGAPQVLSRSALGAAPPAVGRAPMKARPRPDLLDKDSPKGIAVFQLTTEPDVPGSHLYMEAQIFTLDSKRLVLHRSATAHGGSKNDPKHQYLLCDLENGGELSPLTQETGATAASVSPGDKYMYYFVDETAVSGGRLTLKRVRLDGADRRTIGVVEKGTLGGNLCPSHIYPLSTISSDGQRLALSCFLGDGSTENADWGLMVFDVEPFAVKLIIRGPTWLNMHPQYCRSKDPEASHDLLIQENHGSAADAKGSVTRLVGGEGADIHVVRDDGTNFRNLPWGRDGNEFCQGHQCWRGRSTWAITSTGTRKPSECQLIEGRATGSAGHVGIKSPGGVRNDLTRDFPKPRFYHFGTDLEGKRLVSDAGPLDKQAKIYRMELGEAGKEPARSLQYLLSPKSSCVKTAHIHPFLSPNGKLAFFNSDESGILQAYLIRGLD